MKIFAYTENYAHKTVTFITNELKYVDTNHTLLLAYSTRINPDLYKLKNMIHIPYQYNKLINKMRWWLEQFHLYYWLKNSSFKKQLNQSIRQFKPDLIQCHFGVDFLKLAANLDSDNKNIPVLVSFYGFDVTEKVTNKAILKQYQKYFASKNIYSIAVANSLAKNANLTIQPKNKTITLNSGIDTDFFKRKQVNRKPSEYTFIQVSSFLQKKGHHYTLEAFRKFIDEDKRYNYKFKLAGYGPLENEIIARINELKLEEHVTLQGPITPAEMIDWCSEADCFVQMSIIADNGDQEGLPNILLEVMSLELPILSTKHAGIPEIVIDGENGILCEEKNIKQYVEGFKKIVDWKLCPHSRERAINHFSTKAHTDKLENIYRQMTSLK